MLPPNKIVICGVGLIGGSFALALKQANAVSEIVGMGRTAASLETAQRLGVIDRATTDAADMRRPRDGPPYRGPNRERPNGLKRSPGVPSL